MKDFISVMNGPLDGRTAACRVNLWQNMGSLLGEPVSLPVLVDLGWASLCLHVVRQSIYYVGHIA
jgi:hypothetical protein